MVFAPAADNASNAQPETETAPERAVFAGGDSISTYGGTKGADTVKLRVTVGAAGKLVFPGCPAVIEHPPAPTIVMVVPQTEQTVGVVELKATEVRLAVALMAITVVPIVTLFSAPKEMVCNGGATGAESVAV